ncbi:MAG: sterol carrier protein domain-containing protein, partial [Enterococcus sp.]
ALNIQTLTCMLMNYRRAAYLARIERLEADKKAIELLETTIPDMEAYFSDYF